MSQRPEARVETDTLILAPFESQSLEWITNRSNIVFDRLILVSIFQRQYQELEARHGSCSIYVYSIFGLSGKSTLIAIIEIGVLSALLGIGLLYYVLQPFSARAKKLMGANFVFLALVLLGLFSTFPRLWGLTLMFNSMAILAIIVAYVDIILSKN
jgi:hypothetical protein